jgi:hypothetical protein
MSIPKSKRVLRTLNRSTLFFGYHLMVAMLVVQLGFPQLTAFADPPKSENQGGVSTTEGLPTEWVKPGLAPLALPDFRGALPDDESNAIIAAQGRRNALISLPNAQAFNDVYFTSPQVQWGEMAEYTRTNKALNDENGIIELDETDAEGRTSKVRYQVTVARFEPGKLNESFNRPPHSFSLDGDVKIEVKDGVLTASMEEVHGKGKRIYRRKFRIPGIVSTLINSSFIHILLANGELKSIFGSHNRLFQFNELAGGGALLVATTSVITNPELLEADGRLKTGITLQNHDARRGKGIYGHNFTPETISTVRYGDLEVLGTENGEQKVVELLPLAAIAEVADGHLQLLKVREDILSGEKPLQALLAGADKAKTLSETHPELLPHGRSLSGLVSLVSQPTLSASFRRLPEPWKDKPWEMPAYSSRNLDQLQKFISALQSTAQDPSSRATYPGSDRVAAPGTREAQLFEDEQIVIGKAKALALKSTDLGWAASFFKKHQNGAMILASLAAVQAIIYFMPNSPMWVQTKLFNINTSFPGLDIPLGALGSLTTSGFPIHLHGPTVPYILKFWLFAGSIAATTFVALPLSFAYLSERVLGRSLPRGFQVGMKQTMESGWDVFTTFGLRLASYLLISWRDSVVRLTSGFSHLVRETIPNTAARVISKPLALPLTFVGWLLGSITKADGLPGVMHAMRYGQNPVAYLTHDQANKRSTFASVTGALSKLRSSTGADASEVQSAQEAVDLTAYQMSLFSLMSVLAKKNIIQNEGAVDSTVFRREVGEEKFEILEQRFRLLANRVKKVLKAMPTNGKETNFEQLMQTVVDNGKLEEALSDPFLPLNAEEAKELGNAEKSAKIARYWPRAAGSNEIFFRFRNAEASRGNVTVWSQNFQNDIGTHPLWMGVTPGDDAFASSANPGNLLFGDSTSATAGLVGSRGLVEMTCNIFAWISNIPTDELTYGDTKAVGVPEDHLNPQRIVDGRSPMYRTIRDANPASLAQSMVSYGTWMLPWNADFWHAYERLANRITKDQLRTWKNFLIAGTATTFVGLLMEWGSLKPEQQVVGVALLAAGVKTLLFNTYAYLFYRNFWMGHSIGVRNNTIEPDNDSRELTNLVMNARDAVLEAAAGDHSKVGTAYEKIAAMYERFGKTLPSDITSIANPVDRLDKASVYSVAAPPMVTAVHGFSGLATNQAMTVITTVIGTYGSALVWKYAFDTSWFTVGAIIGGLYGVAKIAGWVSTNMRAALTYNSGVASLRKAIEAAKADPSDANNKKLFATILNMLKVYQRHDAAKVFEGRGLELLRNNADLVTIGTDVYGTAVANPPVNNWATQRAVAREKATDLCAIAVANAAKPVVAVIDAQRAVNE